MQRPLGDPVLLWYYSSSDVESQLRMAVKRFKVRNGIAPTTVWGVSGVKTKLRIGTKCPVKLLNCHFALGVECQSK